jgi:hypothetical protein
MKRTLTFAAIVAALLATAVYAFGDIARPKPSPETKTVLHTGLTIVPDAKIYEARLQIPQETLKLIMEGAGTAGADQSLSQRVIQSSTRTIMAGLFMFLAISFAGVWLARSGDRRNRKTIAATLLVAFGFGLATVMVRANAGPPGSYFWQKLPSNLSKGQPTSAGVNIEIVSGEEGQIKLVVPIRNNNGKGDE